MANAFRQEYDFHCVTNRRDGHVFTGLLLVVFANQIERERSLVIVELHDGTLHVAAVEALLRNRKALVIIAAPGAEDRCLIDGRLRRIDAG